MKNVTIDGVEYAPINDTESKLAEAREKAIEEAALVAENFPESKSEGCAEAIRSLKQPNQKDTQ
jgi:hypothetical protein